MTDDNQRRPHSGAPDFPVERTELPEWRQVPPEEDTTRALAADTTTRMDHPEHSAPGSGTGTSAGGPPVEQHPTSPDSGTPGAAAAERLPAPGGPAWGTVAFGVVCLAVAGGALTLQLFDVTVDWRYAVPVAFAGLGALLVLVGLVGLTSRRQRD